MARGQKYNDDLKEKAIALLTVNNSVSFVARELKLPRSTVKSWKEDYDKKAGKDGKDTVAKLRQKKKEKFVEDAWRLVDKVKTILERRLDRAIQSEDKMDELLEEILQLDYKQLTVQQRKALYTRISALKIEDIKALSTVLGTLYDKQALANKEATQIVDFSYDNVMKMINSGEDY